MTTAPARFELATLKLTASCTAVVLQGIVFQFYVIEDNRSNRIRTYIDRLEGGEFIH